MKNTALSLVLLALGLSAHADTAPVDAAEAAALEFLALVDEHRYEESYKTASTVLRNEVAQEEWAAHIRNIREPFGQLNQRTVVSSDVYDSLPDAPPGKYVIFTFDSSFENNSSAAEVVGVVKENDGSWRVVGYYFG